MREITAFIDLNGKEYNKQSGMGFSCSIKSISFDNVAGLEQTTKTPKETWKNFVPMDKIVSITYK